VQIIPVIDLKGGLVVRALRGERDRYQPFATPLSPTSKPVDVVAGLLRLFPFPSLYCADLDAIEKSGASDAELAQIRAAFPALSLWVDCGTADADAARAFLAAHARDRLVIGSESIRGAAVMADLRSEPRVVLSLDFRGDSFLGPQDLLDQPELWPATVIVMTLAKVGSGDGPDQARIAEIRRAAGGRSVVAAGGVRDAADLHALAQDGVAGALVASALHDGRLAPDDLAEFATGREGARLSPARRS
jgi:phosphoribosylformimino-5-aminoimidazole carboxamide ribotide isomerase